MLLLFTVVLRLFLVIEARGGTWFRTPCPIVVRSRSKCQRFGLFLGPIPLLPEISRIPATYRVGVEVSVYCLQKRREARGFAQDTFNWVVCYLGMMSAWWWYGCFTVVY